MDVPYAPPPRPKPKPAPAPAPAQPSPPPKPSAETSYGFTVDVGAVTRYQSSVSGVEGAASGAAQSIQSIATGVDNGEADFDTDDHWNTIKNAMDQVAKAANQVATDLPKLATALGQCITNYTGVEYGITQEFQKGLSNLDANFQTVT